MLGYRFSIGLKVLAIFTIAVVITSAWAAAQEQVLHNFNNNGTDGALPQSGLIVDVAGNLYGTTNNGGTYNYGTVFELSPAAGGTWTEKILHNFSNSADGGNPQYGLIFDALGNLYGTTYVGGAFGYGTAFELSPAGGGTWTEKVLYSFGGTNTAYPTSGLIFDGAGNLYGTALQGGPAQGGSVFELSPAGGGTWTERDLHVFGSLSTGLFPYGGVVFDAAGNLYGTTSTGGSSSGGTVFELAAGTWTMGILHNFTKGTDGETPYAGLVLSGGNLYGTTSGNSSGWGTVYKLTPAGGGNWSYQVVHNFGTGNDGATPYAGLLADSLGNLYGTTLSGGNNGGGTVFRFNSHGELVLHSFGLAEGYNLVAPLTSDASGNLYSTTNFGGTHGAGTVFELTPPIARQFVAVTPCRVVDTRNPTGPFGGPPIQGGTYRSFQLPQGACSIPPDAAAYSLNVTVVPSGYLGYVTIWPTGQLQPVVSTMNSFDGRIKADAAIVPAGSAAGVSVFASNTTNVILDINGYFVTPTAQTLQFYPLTPCRVADTRNPNGQLGGPYLSGGAQRDFPVTLSSCIPQGPDIRAYSFNFTAVPHPVGHQLGYLTVWPAGNPKPTVSTLNNPTATLVANAAIVPAGSGGAVSTYVDQNTDLVIDVDGYFAPAGPGGLSLYSVPPCRVLDTRNGNGQPFSGERTVNVAASACAPPSDAAAYVFNATVVPSGSLAYLTLWPDGPSRPLASTLNAADGFITSNMAIVPTSNGSIDAYAAGLTQLILDISSYFAP